MDLLGNYTIKQITFIDSNIRYAYDPRAEGLGITDISNLVVTGHSLGGHLSSAFSRLFPDIVEHAYMVNGAGYSSDANPIGTTQSSFNIAQVFSILGGSDSFQPDKIANITGDKAIDFIANDWFFGLNQPGSQPELFIETMSWSSNLIRF